MVSDAAADPSVEEGPTAKHPVGRARLVAGASGLHVAGQACRRAAQALGVGLELLAVSVLVEQHSSVTSRRCARAGR